MIVIGIDPGLTNPALALVDVGATVKLLYARAFVKEAALYGTKMMLWERCHNIAGAMAAEFYLGSDVTGYVLAIEGPYHNPQASQTSIEALACIRQALFYAFYDNSSADAYCVSPKEAKLSLTGRGNADKGMMIGQAYLIARGTEYEPIFAKVAVEHKPSGKAEAIADAIGISVAGAKLHKIALMRESGKVPVPPTKG